MPTKRRQQYSWSRLTHSKVANSVTNGNEELPEMMNPQTLKGPEQRDACGQTMETDSMDELHKKRR